jgi:ABC-type polysaccharide/polyol phosphate transport system ATPase subunit
MIEVNNLSKFYNLEKNQWKRILQRFGLVKMNEGSLYKALHDVSFKIERGQTVGIIGNNGAGKSTLLQVVSGTLKASGGTVVRPNRIAALLELGAGFNPDFTGRENVYLNGALIGMTRNEINQKFSDIHDFSGIGSFIDQPVKTYSSGMFARLAFSVAVHSSPNLLIVDEALSVGDTKFQEKSINKMKQLRDNGIPIFFVSHSIPMVRNFCDRVIWLDEGTIREDGPAKEVCEHYLENLRKANKKEALKAISQTPDNPSIIIDSYNLNKKIVSPLNDLEIKIGIKKLKEVRDGFGIGIIITDDNGNIVSIISTVRDDLDIFLMPEIVVLKLNNLPLISGVYYISISITDELSTFHYDRIDNCLSFEVLNEYNKKGIPRHEGKVGVLHEWVY